MNAVAIAAAIDENTGGDVAFKHTPVVLSTASEIYKLAELRDYQRCLLMHRDGACHGLVAYYERLWTYLLTQPTAREMATWQRHHVPPDCRSPDSAPLQTDSRLDHRR